MTRPKLVKFASPFPEEFDPRADVYEVVELDASGALRVASTTGQLGTIAPIQVAAGPNPNPQDRVLGVLESPPAAANPGGRPRFPVGSKSKTSGS
ncbi:MAG: hypothetical protein ACT4TC_00255 [Myxococcaceae bacterium]